VPALAGHATATGHARLDRYGVAGLERGDGGADAVDCAGGFVAEDHGGFDDEGADSAVLPVVDLVMSSSVSCPHEGGLERMSVDGSERVGYITAANAGPSYADEDIVWALQLGDRSFFIAYRQRL